MENFEQVIKSKLVSIYGTFAMCQKRYEEFDFDNRARVVELMSIDVYISVSETKYLIDYVIDNDKVLLFNAAVMYLMDMRAGKIFRGQVPILNYIGKDYKS